jgi:hypothetical protein
MLMSGTCKIVPCVSISSTSALGDPPVLRYWRRGATPRALTCSSITRVFGVWCSTRALSVEPACCCCCCCCCFGLVLFLRAILLVSPSFLLTFVQPQGLAGCGAKNSAAARCSCLKAPKIQFVKPTLLGGTLHVSRVIVSLLSEREVTL